MYQNKSKDTTQSPKTLRNRTVPATPTNKLLKLKKGKSEQIVKNFKGFSTVEINHATERLGTMAGKLTR